MGGALEVSEKLRLSQQENTPKPDFPPSEKHLFTKKKR